MHWDKTDGEKSMHVWHIHTYMTTIIQLVIDFDLNDEMGFWR
jgi:hypothetical protein